MVKGLSLERVGVTYDPPMGHTNCIDLSDVERILRNGYTEKDMRVRAGRTFVNA